MKFEEEKARQIQSEFGLSPATIKVWRFRGKIPKKYATIDADLAGKVDSPALQEWERLSEKLDHPAIVKKKFAETCGISYSLFYDIERGKSMPSEGDVLALRRQLAVLRTEIKHILEARSFKKAQALQSFLNREEINTKGMFYALNRQEVQRMNKFKRQTLTLDEVAPLSEIESALEFFRIQI